jgi:hypothetical protein
MREREFCTFLFYMRRKLLTRLKMSRREFLEDAMYCLDNPS